ncbi:hypothetical protein GWI33_003817, partial [Rhynchophorus ferrugineus]
MSTIENASCFAFLQTVHETRKTDPAARWQIEFHAASKRLLYKRVEERGARVQLDENQDGHSLNIKICELLSFVL